MEACTSAERLHARVSSESVSSTAAMVTEDKNLASKAGNSFPLDRHVQHQWWQIAASLGAVPDRRASWVIYGARLRRRCPAWCASLVALATLSSLASAGVVQPTLSKIRPRKYTLRQKVSKDQSPMSVTAAASPAAASPALPWLQSICLVACNH